MSYWVNESVFYHIYPIGFCGAPRVNDGETVCRLDKVIDWIPHLKSMSINAIYFGPVFKSTVHGYDTDDYRVIDNRLGTNESFKHICDELHKNGIKVVLDGVFNHVGRNFWAFKDVCEKGSSSQYCGWFQNLNFGGKSPYGDSFSYEGWHGYYDLVKLNLKNPDVKNYLLDSVGMWMDEFKIDGLRLDAADCVDPDFFKALRHYTKSKDSNFWLMGEIIHGDYNRWANPEMLDSVTNYECYKGLYSSFNSANMHEIAYSLNRQFGSEQWCLYTGRHLLSFLDNHDVSRIATVLTDKAMLRPAYGLLFGMPGVPAVYYGSEWGLEGDKKNGDATLRPAIEKPQENELTEWISALAKARAESPALRWGSYHNVMVQPRQLIFERRVDGERVLVAINAAGETYHADFNAGCGTAVDLITGQPHDFGGGSDLPPYSCAFWRMEH